MNKYGYVYIMWCTERDKRVERVAEAASSVEHKVTLRNTLIHKPACM